MKTTVNKKDTEKKPVKKIQEQKDEINDNENLSEDEKRFLSELRKVLREG